MERGRITVLMMAETICQEALEELSAVDNTVEAGSSLVEDLQRVVASLHEAIESELT